MAISFVGGQKGSRAGSVSAATITYALAGGSDSTPQPGDLVLIAIGVGTVDRVPACQITTPSGFAAYGQLDVNNSGVNFDTSMDVNWKFMGGTPDTTFDLPSTGNASDAQTYAVLVFRGVDAGVDDVASTTATGTGTARCNPASITPVTVGAWPVICGCGAVATGLDYTAPANYSTNFQTTFGSDDNDSLIGCGYRSDWSAGAEDPAVYGAGSVSASGSWAARTIALKPANTALPFITSMSCQRIG